MVHPTQKYTEEVCGEIYTVTDEAKSRILAFVQSGRRYIPFGLLKSSSTNCFEEELAIRFSIDNGLPVAEGGRLITSV